MAESDYGTCSGLPDGVGRSACISAPVFYMLRGAVLAVSGQSFASVTAAETEANWKSDIADKNLFPLGALFEEFEDTSGEDLTAETSAQTKIFIKDGKYGVKVDLLLTPDQNAILRTYNNKNWGAYIFDDFGSIKGRTSGDLVKPFSLSYFRVSKSKMALSAEGYEASQIEFRFEDATELNEDVLVLASDNLNSEWESSVKDVLSTPLTKVTATAGDLATDTFTLNVAHTLGNYSNGGFPSVPIIGLLTANVVVYDSSGDVITGATVAESATTEGEYTISSATDATTAIIVASSDSLFYTDTFSIPTT